MIVEFGGKFVKTSPIPFDLWAWSTLFGFISMPLALLLKLALPVHEAEATFFGYEMPKEDEPVPPELAALVSGYDSNGVARVDDHHV